MCDENSRHTSGIVKRDKLVGLDVVDQRGHRLVCCHFLSSCALWGQEVRFTDVWTGVWISTWTRMNWMNWNCSHSRYHLPHLTSSFSPHLVPLFPLAPRCPPQQHLPLVKHNHIMWVTPVLLQPDFTWCLCTPPWFSWVLGAGVAGSSAGLFVSGVGTPVAAVCSVAAFLVCADFAMLPFLFLMRILPMSSLGLGICWPGFN